MMLKKILSNMIEFALVAIFIANLVFAENKVYVKGFDNGAYIGKNTTSGTEDIKINQGIYAKKQWNNKSQYSKVGGGAAISTQINNFSFELEWFTSGQIQSQNRKNLFKEVYKNSNNILEKEELDLDGFILEEKDLYEDGKYIETRKTLKQVGGISIEISTEQKSLAPKLNRHVASNGTDFVERNIPLKTIS